VEVLPFRLRGQAAWLIRDLTRYPRYAWRCLRRPSRIRLHGVVLALDESTPESVRQLLYSERYERGEVRGILASLEPHDRVLEMGAGIGYVSTLCARRIGSDRVVSVEANPELLPVIRRTYLLNGVAPLLLHGLMGGGGGTATFHAEDHFPSSSQQQRSTTALPVDVPRLDAARTLDELRPTFVVMDIEGGEAELVPLLDWRGVRKLALEIHPDLLGPADTAGTLEHLERLGFREVGHLSSTRKKLFVRRGGEEPRGCAAPAT
jgi:FkbM family methyltransferase